MESWIWIARWFLFCVRYSRLLEYTIKKHETLTAIPPIHVYINRMKNKLVFKMEDGYKLELQMPDARKLFDSKKKLIDETKNGENVPSLEVDEVV